MRAKLKGMATQSHAPYVAGGNDRRSASAPKVWFPGLNALRFLAAGLVVLTHCHSNMAVAGLPQLPGYPLLFQGSVAVSFFFTLSGFLITYHLMEEYRFSGNIRVRSFYGKRAFRIWPVYIIVIIFGLIFYWVIVPLLGLPFKETYPLSVGVVCFTFFLANLVTSLYHVGGILNITWSIAVEEQFYLVWGPLVKRFSLKLLSVIISLIAFSGIVAELNLFNVFHLSPGLHAFVQTLQFHYMGIGGAFAWLLFRKPDLLLSSVVFRSRMVQRIGYALILLYFLLYRRSVVGDALTILPLGVLFGWLIVNTSSNDHRILSLEHKCLEYLGKISYGIYMYHVPVIYAVSFLFLQLPVRNMSMPIYFTAYITLVFSVTVALASVSYAFIERPLLTVFHSLSGRK